MDTNTPLNDVSAESAATSGEPSTLPLPAGHRRNAVRRIFREMVREELQSGALPSWKRKELIAFASTAGLDRYEARLTVRAVEYEMGFAADPALDPADEDEPTILTPVAWFMVRLTSAVALGFMLAWFVGRVRGRF